MSYLRKTLIFSMKITRRLIFNNFLVGYIRDIWLTPSGPPLNVFMMINTKNFYSVPFLIVTNKSPQPSVNRQVSRQKVKFAIRQSEKYPEYEQSINMNRFGKTFWFFTFGFFFNNCAFNVLAQLQERVKSNFHKKPTGRQSMKYGRRDHKICFNLQSHQ